MDEFGVLVESIGFKAHGRSAPMAKSKARPKANPNSHFIPNVNSNTSPAFNGSSSSTSLPVDELDGIFRSGFSISQTRKTPDFIGSDGVFGGPSNFGGSDLDSLFASSNGAKSTDSDSNSMDLFGSTGPKSYGFDDLFGGFSAREVKNGTGFDDLLPGFGGAYSTSRNESQLDKKIPFSGSIGHPPASPSTMIDDQFSVFQSSFSQSNASWTFHFPVEKDTAKDAVETPFDDLLMGGVKCGSKVGVGANVKTSSFAATDNLDTIFGSSHGGQRNNNNAAPIVTAHDPLFDSFFPQQAKVPFKQASPQSSHSTKKNTSSAINVGDAFTSLFGDDTNSSGEFVEVAGEPEERRRARLNRHMRMNARMAEALAEKNQRDLQIRLEQEEKYRLSETLDSDLKRWAAGKEGNLRALLSSLQQVLWAECGWRPVSLTDMITSESVKKVYKKATLCVHPDKVQQKGANLQQRYIAEKVFDLLKEAWTKFSAEELR